MSKLTLTCSAVDKSDNNIIDLFNTADVLPRCNIKATESIVNENGASLSPVGLSISNKLPFAELEDIDAPGILSMVANVDLLNATDSESPIINKLPSPSNLNNGVNDKELSCKTVQFPFSLIVVFAFCVFNKI